MQDFEREDENIVFWTKGLNNGQKIVWTSAPSSYLVAPIYISNTLMIF
jgi:hypothetical protein